MFGGMLFVTAEEAVEVGGKQCKGGKGEAEILLPSLVPVPQLAFCWRVEGADGYQLHE